jgi:metal-responsive CopG/Arc/MetJ family transcriptional regulator
VSELSRVTLVLPKHLWEKVKQLVPAGQRSRLVADALEVELRRRQRLEQVDELKRFHSYMREKYGQFPSSAPDIEAMRQERDDEISGLH